MSMPDKQRSSTDSNILPFQLSIADQSESTRQWKTQSQLFFLLSGSAEVTIESEKYEVKSEDVFLINSNDIYQIIGKAWKMLVVSFRPDKLAPSGAAAVARFDLCSAGDTYNTAYDFVRYCIAQLASLSSRKEPFYSAQSIFFALFSHLSSNFPALPSQTSGANRLARERLTKILNYIDRQYKDCLTLNETAEHFGLSSPYLSAFFKKQTGQAFMEYYNEIRLRHAVDEMLTGTDSIETIAQNNGFRDPRAFTSLFQKKYQMLPNRYRREFRREVSESPDTAGVSGSGSLYNAGIASMLTAFPSLLKYRSVFREETDFLVELSDNSRIIDAGSLQFDAAGTHLDHNYHTMICVGNAKQFLYEEIREMLRRVQQEIHFKYVKFHGILSDDMMVYSEDSHGIPHYSFTFIDKVIDFMLSIDLRPLCQLSFMPIALAEDPSRLVDYYHYNTSPPKSLKKWIDLVTAFTKHLISRYGEDEVSSWPFCVWNEPDETVDQFAWDDRERFFDFYYQTFRAVKNVCPGIAFGTPSFLLAVQKEQGWVGDFFKYLKVHDCDVDFLNVHYYDNSLFAEDAADRVRGERGYSVENMERSFPLTVDPYAFVKFIDNVKALLRKHNMRHLPVYLTEWNLTISHRDLINDTCFKSCHLVKNLLENYDRLNSFGYWCLTDFEEELQVPADLYHGGLGLFTYNGIPKANYNAFRLLGRLGDELLAKGDGYFITRKDHVIVILLYNYEHYSKLFATGFRSNQNSTDRYTAFEEMSTAQFTVRLTELPYQKALIKERFVNQAAGSSYDAWARMGSLPVESEDDMEILMQQSVPGLYLHQETVENGELTLHTRMAPLEIRLLEIEPIG